MKNSYIPIVVFIIKIVLGITFIYASFHKIEAPSDFVKVLSGYGIFPDISINILAITIPFIELTAGFSLMLGWYPKSAVLIINALLFLFIIVIGFNLIRGHAFDCGCFVVSFQDSRTSNIYVLIRDLVLLGGGIFVYRQIRAS